MNKLLAIIDYQNDFVDGALGFEGAKALDKPICERIDRAVLEGWDVVFTLDTHSDDYLSTQEGSRLPVPHCIRGTHGWELYGLTAARAKYALELIEKPSFGSDRLYCIIREGGYDEIELCGLVSNICVLTNAALAKTAAPEAVVRVDSRLTMCADNNENMNALNSMRAIQVEVI